MTSIDRRLNYDSSIAVHGGTPYPAFNFLYGLPSPFSTVTGAFFVLAGGNRAIVERTFGLFELNKSKTPELSYGTRFRYDEFLVRKGIINAVLTSAIFVLSLFLLAFFAPARWFFKMTIPSSGNGPTEA